MTTEELLSKLRAEVERIRKSYDVYLARITKEDVFNDLDDFLYFLDTLEENSEKPNNHLEGLANERKTLDDAAREYSRTAAHHDIGIRPIPFNINISDLFNLFDIRDAFKAGAEWMKKQLLP